MANTLDGLIPILYKAMDIVARELVGFIPAVSRDSTAERAALNQTVRSPVAPAATIEAIVPGMDPPDTGDASIGYKDMTINKSYSSPIRWTGEEQKALRTGDLYEPIVVDRVAQSIRALVNAIESDLAGLYKYASRAYGLAGTAPFGTADDFTDVAQVRKILDDNGVPQQDLQLVLGSAAWANIRAKQASLWKVNEAGTQEFLREGFISQGWQGFALRNSAQVKTHTKGTGTGYLSDLVAGYAVGDTVTHVDTGTGTILQGDVGVWTGDANKYIISTGFAGDGDADITLAKPGLQATLANDVALTIGANYRANMAFHRSAIQLATRFPATPEEGDKRIDEYALVDPLSGLQFEVAVYPLYRAVRYEISIAWGVAAIKDEFIALLLG